MEIFFSEIAKFKFQKLTNYLLENWSLQTKNNFLKKFDLKIIQIKHYPYSCIESFENKEIFEKFYKSLCNLLGFCLVSKMVIISISF